MTEKSDLQEEFKIRFGNLMRDMSENVRKDDQQMMILGGLADMTTKSVKTGGWSDMKKKMNAQDYDHMLGHFQDQGNTFAKNGERKEAYACEILGISLVARTMRGDPSMEKGDDILDQMIDDTITFYQKNMSQLAAKKSLN